MKTPSTRTDIISYTFFNTLFKIFSDPVVKIALASSNVDRSLKFWNELLQMKIYEKKDNMALLGFADNQAKLCLIDIGGLYPFLYSCYVADRIIRAEAGSGPGKKLLG